jgi:NTE family protein
MRTVAVLGGGGAKALAHIGAWRALSEAGMRPDAIVGTSMGAVVGAALAAGTTVERVTHLAHQAARSPATIPNPVALVAGSLADGLFLPGPLREMIHQFVPVDRFEDLVVPLVSTMVDLQTGRLVLCGSAQLAAAYPGITDGFPLRIALEASCALPVYFPPVVIFGRRYADGGVRAVLPLDAARLFEPETVVAIHTGAGFDDIPSPAGGNALIPPMVRAHGEAVRILMAEQSERAVELWPQDGPRLVLVRAVNETEATFARGSGDRYIEMGYQATKRALEVTD